MLRSTFGIRRPEQESFYIVTIACRVTERERNQICRRQRHSSKPQNSPSPAFAKVVIDSTQCSGKLLTSQLSMLYQMKGNLL